MRGLLADVNVQGHLLYLCQLFESLDLESVLIEIPLEFATFADLQIPQNLDDRSLWQRCQQDGWVLFTDNRNDENENSLHATLADSWHKGCFPVLTLANKKKFERNSIYAERVAVDVAELLFGIAHQEYRDRPRIYVPR